MRSAKIFAANSEQCRIETVADNLIHTVKYKVEEFTGMQIKKVNILVEVVRVIE